MGRSPVAELISPLYNPARERPFRYDLLAWFTIVHVAGIVAIWHMAYVHFSINTAVMAGLLFLLVHLSITMGPHRLYSHDSYKASRALELGIAVVNPGAMQDGIPWWSGHHIDHHKYTDTPRDPYSVLHGFWWAHCIWHLYSTRQVPPSARKLMRKPILVWQQRNHVWLGALVGFGLPTGLGALWGDWVGGFLVGGFLRLVVQYHTTWSINSVAHYFGKSRYGVGTGRSNAWLGPLTAGEGTDHGRHHVAPDDCRIDPRWWALDFGKWAIWLCSKVKLAYDLRRVPEEVVQKRAALLRQTATA
ncbi:hypothetical protein A2761_01380 [Candidatus Kaiserbacteria bacterium RIFCSPHIGHO2_01_FULL_51_33]|uniref:Fatty acid desaturase domain-containing protein n=1 Tax=Candidatus Kaiserbacteria bacterium RIFCSPLOWO2_01_FULL_51_21 TaxID=1798508 RepID=A0A1F6ECN3_9BACT|nr:MAG: hypothetical protein A2761_01380 [Candidatus Kaiserbacteria bacterium RIFCSPHIGHO2_01_FULL_51_33]OGG71406.1 MAG: hypothetical protein A3A35_01530 [Candidatus Kaiserbacteria bacterium RIFCSPLOWO2_01_FULL_51_21]